MFIFNLIYILADCQKKKLKKRLEGALENYTSDREACSKKFVLLFQGSYSYLGKLQSAKPFFASQKIMIGKFPVKTKTIRKEERKRRRRRREKRGEERYSMRNGP